MRRIARLNAAMNRVFCRAAMMTMKDASMTMLELEKPRKAVAMSVTPKSTISAQAIRGAAPKGTLSVMISQTMKAVTRRAIIIGTVIIFFLLLRFWGHAAYGSAGARAGGEVCPVYAGTRPAGRARGLPHAASWASGGGRVRRGRRRVPPPPDRLLPGSLYQKQISAD